MLDHQKGEIKVECDGCGEVYDTGTDDFNDVRTLLKRDGWSIRKIAEEWVHFCPRCGA
jgi:hypothetical protein